MAALTQLTTERDSLLAELEAKSAAFNESQGMLWAAQEAHAQAQNNAVREKEAADKVCLHCCQSESQRLHFAMQNFSRT